MQMAGYSVDNIAFGQGGQLLQALDRDTMKWAMKCCTIGVRDLETGELIWRDVFKDPITDHGKVSKKGRVELFQNVITGEYVSGVNCYGPDMQCVLDDVYLNGRLLRDQTFDDIRANANKGV